MLRPFKLYQKRINIIIVRSKSLLFLQRPIGIHLRIRCYISIAPCITLEELIGQTHDFGKTVTEFMRAYQSQTAFLSEEEIIH